MTAGAEAPVVGVASELGDRLEQPADIGLVVVMDETSADGTSAVADPERPGELPGVVVAVPDIDSTTSEVLGDLAGRGRRR